MAKKKEPPNREPTALAPLQTGTNPLAEVEAGVDLRQHRPSEDLIYESIMRGGGEPFGTPYEVGVASLTEKIVQFFKQKSFFRFETFENARPKRRRNRFTRAGASRFHGTFDAKAAKWAASKLGSGEAKGRGKKK